MWSSRRVLIILVAVAMVALVVVAVRLGQQNHRVPVLNGRPGLAGQTPQPPGQPRPPNVPHVAAPTATTPPPPVGPQESPKPQLDGPVVKLVRRMTVPGAQKVIFSHDGRKLIAMSNPGGSAGRDVWIDCFATDTGRRLFRVYNGDIELNPMQAVFSPDDRVIYHQRRSRDGRQRGPCAISAETGETIWWRSGDGNETGGLAASPDGRYLAVSDRECLADGSYTGCVYHADSGRTEATLRKVKLGYGAFVFSPKGSLMAEQTGEGLRVVSTDDWMLRYSREGKIELIGNCRDGLAGMIGWGPDCQLVIMDWATGRTLAKRRVPHLEAVSPLLKWYVRSDHEIGCEIRSLPGDQLLQRLALPGKGGFRGLSDDGRWIAVGHGDEMLILRTTDQ